jgi:8-oxo-dGTP pyrophosphatase MutT (NUDIX family)
MTSKWRTLSSKSVVKNRWLDVRADQCVTPAGIEINPYYVLTYPEWVHVVAITPDRHIVLVRQYRHAAAEVFMELPSGGVEETDISIEHAAQRELREETGFISQCWQPLSVLYPNPATHTNRVHAFLALDAVAEHAQRLDEGEEGLGVCVAPFEQIVDRLETGILGQAMHVSSVLLALRSIGRGWDR